MNVLRILDEDGDTVVTYSYDPWGAPTITGNTALAAINPCSYRGYDCDEETGYYYLQSRYYDPTIGRFINADEASLPLLDPLVVLCSTLLMFLTENGMVIWILPDLSRNLI